MRISHLLFVLFLIPSFSHAAEQVRWKQSRGGGISFWVMHSEEGVTYLERFEQARGGLQRRKESHAFASAAPARKAFQALSAGYHTGLPLGPAKRFPITEAPGESVWTAQNSWTADWESRFSDWVRDEVDSHFFEKYHVATDCADVPISLRWIFARINSLPAADQLTGTGVLFTNESMLEEWKSLPSGGNWFEDQRFLAALNYVLNNTFTHTLMKDLYPTEITPAGLRSGTILLHLYSEETGHTEFVRLTGASQPGAITMLASDVPRVVRELHEYGIQDWGYPPQVGHDGFLHFRWPEKASDGRWQLLAPEKMPFYSLEQYDPHFSDGSANFTDAVIRRAVPDFVSDPATALHARVGELLQRLRQRVKVVEDGFAYCSANGCPEGSPAWETWSTPSRDAALLRLNLVVWGLYQQDNCDWYCKRQLDDLRETELTRIATRPYTLADALSAWLHKKFVSDPNQPIPARWGW